MLRTSITAPNFYDRRTNLNLNRDILPSFVHCELATTSSQRHFCQIRKQRLIILPPHRRARYLPQLKLALGIASSAADASLPMSVLAGQVPGAYAIYTYISTAYPIRRRHCANNPISISASIDSRQVYFVVFPLALALLSTFKRPGDLLAYLMYVD